MQNRRAWLFGATALATLLGGSPALAQQADEDALAAASESNVSPGADSSDDESAGGEIIVTAQRREASLQDVGATISVITADSLAQVGINDSQNLQVLVPGLIVSREVSASNQLFIRGVGNNILGIGTANSVATYVDGVYMPNSQQSFQIFNDIERVEVLKGPQAVLYGRNATGGALLITTQAPSFAFGAKGDISYGNYDAVLARATVTGPLVDDTLAGRVSLQYGNRDAYSINLPSGTGQDFERTFAARAALAARLGSATLTVAGDYSRTNSGDFVKSTNPDAWNYQLSSPSQFTPDPRARFANVDSTIPMRDRGVRGTLNWETSLGDVTSVTSYRKFDVGPFFYDSDGVFLPLTGLAPGFRIEYRGSTIGSNQFYHETFLATPSENPLSAIIGANYFHEKSSNDHRQQVGLGFNHQDRRLNAEAYSGFIDFNYRVTEKVTAIVGGRYSFERKRYAVTPRPANAAGDVIGSGATIGAEDSWSDFTPRFGLEFRPNNDVLVYASATKGFKSGGFNESNPLNSFNPEGIWAYEVGVKSNPVPFVTANLSAFYYDYTDLQVQQIVLPSFARRIENAASATIYGLEAELAARVAEGLRLSANAQVLHSEYGDLTVCIDLFGPCTISQNGQTVLNPASNLNVKGNQLARAPRFSSLVAADYNTPMAWGGRLSINANAAYRSTVYWTPYEVDIHKSDPFWIVNASIRYDFPGDVFFVSLWGQNLTDTLTESHIADVARFLGPGNVAPRYVHWSPPRTYGVRVGFSF